MSEKLPYYIIVRTDADPVEAALAAVLAMEGMGDEQGCDLSNDGYAQTCSVPNESALRALIAEAVINKDYVSVGNIATDTEDDSCAVAIVGPSQGVGPILRSLMTPLTIPTPAPRPESIAEAAP